MQLGWTWIYMFIPCQEAVRKVRNQPNGSKWKTNPQNGSALRYESTSCKVFPIHALKAHTGKWRYSSTYSYPWQSKNSGLQYLKSLWGTSPQYSLNRSMVGHTAGLNTFKKGKISHPCQESSHNSSVVQPIAYSLSWLTQTSCSGLELFQSKYLTH